MYFISLNLLREAFSYQKFKANVLLNNLTGITDGNWWQHETLIKLHISENFDVNS